MLNCFENFFFTKDDFTNMDFFYQQRHNMRKSGVLFGALIILHV